MVRSVKDRSLWPKMVKRAQRDPEFKACIERAKLKARVDPLIAVQKAAQASWRAAA